MSVRAGAVGMKMTEPRTASVQAHYQHVKLGLGTYELTLRSSPGPQ